MMDSGLVRPVHSVGSAWQPNPPPQNYGDTDAWTDEQPFDVSGIYTVPAVAAPPVPVPLIGPGAITGAASFFPPVPVGYVGVVRQIATYLETIANVIAPVGRVSSPLGDWASIWNVTIDQRPPNYFPPYRTITAPWNDTGGFTPILYIPQGLQLRVTYLWVDPSRVYRYVGVRVRGAFVRIRRKPPSES